MYKHQLFNLNLFSYKKAWIVLFTFILYLSFLVSPAFAQSTEQVDFTIAADKTSVVANDTYTFTYSVTNKSTSTSMYNAKIGFNYLDKLEYSTFSGSSTGLSKDDLQNNGYPVNTLAPGKSISFLIYFKVDSSAPTGQQIHFKEGNTTTVSSSMSFKFSSDNNAVSFTKDAYVNLPNISANKPEITSIKYPTGITGTDLSTLDSNSAKSVSGFFLEGVNKITFNTPVDLSTSDAVNILRNLLQNFDLNTTGAVNIAPNSTFDNKKATLVYKNLSFIDAPVLFIADASSDKKINYDSTAKTASVDIDTTGKYTLLGLVKTEIPESTPEKHILITGVLTDPSAKLELDVNGDKVASPIVDLTTGSFTYDYTFTSAGENQINFNTFAKNGVINKQTFTINATGLLATSTPIPATQTPIPKQETYIVALLIAFGIIFFVGIILAGYLTFISLKKRRNKDLLESKNSAKVERSPLEVVNFKKQSNLYTDASENRHEIIRDKVEKNLSDSENTEPFNIESKENISEPEKESVENTDQSAKDEK